MTTAPILIPLFFESAQPVKRRSFAEFAEQEVILPNGPRKGMPFLCSFMEFSREVLEEFSRGRYTEFYGSGPVQAGKTTIFYVIPALYHLFELEEDVILGAPISEMAKSAYQERLLPAIEASRYKRLLPRKGGGSRGGKTADWVRFGNGTSIRFLGAGGGDQQISSYTARVVVATELDKMDEPGKLSRETDPVTKLKARTKAFGSAARFYGECTMSTKGGRIYREVVEMGTDSRVFLPCAYCKEWIWPERKGLVGWQGCENVMKARAQSAYVCPSCQKPWSESDRQAGLKSPRIVARGQAVNREGSVEGPMPETLTYGFRWNAMASPLLRMADIGGEEWRAEQSGKVAELKGVAQFVWTEAWEEDAGDITRPEVATILEKIVGHEKGAIPAETIKVTLGIDVGKYVHWWTLMAWSDGAQGHVVDFGSITVPVDSSGASSAAGVIAALRTFRDTIVNPGWGGRRPDRILIDSGYADYQSVVYGFVAESGQPRYLASKGRGTSSRHGEWHAPSAQGATSARQIGNEWIATPQPGGINLIVHHADYWKARVQDGFWAAQGAPGSITIFNADRTDQSMKVYARMIVAEQRELKQTAAKEPKVVWVLKNKSNHYLDTTALCCIAADIEGVAMVQMQKAPPRKAAVHHSPMKWSRDRY